MSSLKMNRKKIKRAWRGLKTCVVALSLLLAQGSTLALAQAETGSISGTVTDPSGAVVAAANIVIKAVETGLERRSVTSDAGTYTVTNLQPGLYDVRIEAQGFAPRTQRAQVTVGAKVSLDFDLSAQASSEEVTVVAGESGVAVNKESQQLSNTVSERQIVELPTLTRNPYALVQLAGNVSPGEEGDPTGAASRGAGFSINGQRSASTNILLDGVDNNDQFTATVGQSVPLDSVQEFQVITGNFSAEYGRASGGIVNVATKAGSNNFHGTLYEFNRVSALAAAGFNDNANGNKKGVFTRNQFGYSIGGPIIKDKLLFFNSTEWIRVRSSAPTISLVPTPQLLANTSAATQNFFNAFQLATPINGRTITRGDIGGLNDGGPFASLSASLPVFGEVIRNVPANAGGGLPQNDVQIVGRVDWNVSDRSQLYGRYALQDQTLFEGTNAFSPYAGFDTGQTNFNNNFLLSLTHTFNPRWVSQSKAAYNRLNNKQPLGEQAPGPTLYLRNASTSINGLPVALPGYLPFNPGLAIPAGGPQNLLQFNEDLNYLRGSHTFRFGGQYVYIQSNRTFGAFQNSVETLGTNLANALDNLVLGKLFQFQGAINPQGKFPGETITLPAVPPNFSRSYRYHEWATYFNDSWKVTPRVTLNLGLRYEYYGVQHNSNPRLDSNFYLGEGSNLFEQIQNGRVQIAEDSPAGGLWKPDKNNFAPRVGFAWDIFGDGNTSLRGGYGIAYERNFGNVTFNVIQNPPNYAVVSIAAGSDVPSIDITLDNAGPLAGTGTKVLPRTSLRAVNQNIVNSYAHFWSAALERKLFQGVASVEYSGSKGVNLYDLTDPNRAGAGNIFFGIPCDPSDNQSCNARLNTQYSNLNTRGNLGFSNYNGLTFGYETPFIRDWGLQLTARYTWSHAIDNLSSTFSDSANNNNLGLLDPFNPRLDKGDADFDIRHRLITSFVWQIPYRSDQRGWLGKALGGWSINGIYSVHTGAPFTIFDCTNTHLNPVCMRAQQTGIQATSGPGHPAPDPATPGQFQYLPITGLTAGLFVNPLTGNSEFGPFPAGMTGRNAFRAPGFWNLDTGIYKNFRISESKSVQLRGEFFNIFNHSNLYLVPTQTDISQGDFIPAARGLRTDGTQDRRNVQLALKFIF
ncbi:MAG TPA: TonB-dependent receptor [Blastocatellia bacterium]|nr:TonB-dependent receptor [Blastocatellia bacterium]